MTVPLLLYVACGEPPPRLGLNHPTIAPYGAFATSDGHLVLISIQNEREWREFCTSFLEEPELPQRPGFESLGARVANRDAVDAHVGAAFARLTLDEAVAKLRASNTAYGIVNDVTQLAHHPVLRRVPVETPNGVARVAAPPAILSDGPPVLGRVPRIGEHTAAIRAEFTRER
jgi:crotonobetainyl-CoA:carnitine CoA-transferase CaiB-like acyl-CoA transferase